MIEKGKKLYRVLRTSGGRSAVTQRFFTDDWGATHWFISDFCKSFKQKPLSGNSVFKLVCGKRFVADDTYKLKFTA